MERAPGGGQSTSICFVQHDWQEGLAGAHRAYMFTVRKAALLLGHWYEIMALYYVKSILTEISASRQDRRVLQKSKIIRIEFLSKWGMLQTSRYV